MWLNLNGTIFSRKILTQNCMHTSMFKFITKLIPEVLILQFILTGNAFAANYNKPGNVSGSDSLWKAQQIKEIREYICTELHNSICLDSILQRNREMENAFSENDFVKLAAFYSDSAVLVGDKHEIQGRKAIDRYWIGLKDKGVSWNLENIHIEVHGNAAIQRGISRMKYLYEGKEIMAEVRFTLIWKRIKNIWLIEIDHYTLL